MSATQPGIGGGPVVPDLCTMLSGIDVFGICGIGMIEDSINPCKFGSYCDDEICHCIKNEAVQETDFGCGK